MESGRIKDKGPSTFSCPGTQLPSLDQQLVASGPFHCAVTWLWFAVGIVSIAFFCALITVSGGRLTKALSSGFDVCSAHMSLFLCAVYLHAVVVKFEKLLACVFLTHLN